MMDDKQFWLMIRRALLMICKAIEQRYCKDGEKAGQLVTEG